MTDIFALSDEATETAAALDPIGATYQGVTGYDHLWPDLSPEGRAAAAEAWADLRRRAADCTVADDRDHLAQAVLIDTADVNTSVYETGEHLLDLNNIASPHQSLRLIFGSMDTTSDAGWDAVCLRLETTGVALAGYRESLELGRTTGRTVARRQVEAVLEQGRVAVGDDSGFDQLRDRLREWEGASEALNARLDRAIGDAKAAFVDFDRYLAEVYLPDAVEADGVGRDRYAARARLFLGTTLDWEETYLWGWDEIQRLWAEMQILATEIDGEKTAAEVFEMLQTDPAYAMTSVDEFVAFMKDRQNQALSQLDGVHFDVPEQIKTIDVQVEPAGGATAASYIAPSEDFSRPGSVWYPIEGSDFLPLFQEITTAYHEGFPGHHLQVGVQMAQGENLSRLHRSWVWYPGSGEGWALYAERFMDELGYLERPEYRMGLLTSQMLRACRVAIDIGVHLGLPIPDEVDFRPGEPWTFETAFELLRTRALVTEAEAASEVTRYFGWPAQAISYKVGEQAILDLRAEHRARPDFDLKRFHADLLAVGSVGLDLLRDRMG